MFSLSLDNFIWACGALLAATMLISMLNRRQNHLRQLLRAHVEQQIEWAEKRAAALKMAKKAALAREAEDLAAEAELKAVVGEAGIEEATPVASNATPANDLAADVL